MYFSLELLVSNALIELIENKNERKASRKLLLDYGKKVARVLVSRADDVFLLYPRSEESRVVLKYFDFFELHTDDTGEKYISLRKGKTAYDLRDYFRTKMSPEMLKAFTDEEALDVLLYSD